MCYMVIPELARFKCEARKMTSSEEACAVNNNMRENKRSKDSEKMKSKRKLVPRVARQTALVTGTSPAVQSSVAVLVTQHLTTRLMKKSGKTVVGKG